jgi:hypothetical protein
VRKELPIVVAAFGDEEQVHETLTRLEALNVGRDLIGICAKVNGQNGHAHETVHLLSVLAPSRRHGDVERLLLQCNALSVGSAAEMSAAFGATPHPGVFDDGGMKLPMGPDYGSRDGGV